MGELFGSPVSVGLALGPALLWDPEPPRPGGRLLSLAQRKEELARFSAVKAKVREDLQRLFSRLPKDSSRRAPVAAQLELMDNEALDELIRNEIAVHLLPADQAVAKVGDKYIKRLQKSGSLFKERAPGFAGLVSRFLRRYAGLEVVDVEALPGPRVLVAREFTFYELVALDVPNTLAIVTELGSASSHMAGIARSHGIPAVMGVRRATQMLEEGQPVMVNGGTGSVLTSPDAENIRWYAEQKNLLEREKTRMARQARMEVKTLDGVKIFIGLNVGSGGREELAAADMVDHVGMVRTEYLYLNANTLPTRAEHYAYYRGILNSFPGLMVTLRTADLGGDKSPDWLAGCREDGRQDDKRGIRFMLDNPGIFMPQLEAALQLAAEGRVRLMFPMISTLEEYRAAVGMVEQAKARLAGEGVPFAQRISIGLMIETPAAALMADSFAREADFGFIGSNDLCQYLLAADRGSPDMDLYYQPMHPAMLRLIKQTIEAFAAVGKPLGLCGELAGDVRMAPVLVGMGLRDLSMAPTSLAQVKLRLASLSLISMEQLAEDVLTMERTQDVLHRLEQ